MNRLDPLSGAGAAQIFDHTSKPEYRNSLFDDPRDRAAIIAGMDLFDQYGINFTPEQFQKILDQLASQLKGK